MKSIAYLIFLTFVLISVAYTQPTRLQVNPDYQYLSDFTEGLTLHIQNNSNTPDSAKQVWVRHVPCGFVPSTGSLKVPVMSIDDHGNVYVAGTSEESENYEDYVTIKYNSSGVEQWKAFYNGAGNRNDGATDLEVDNQGNVYVTGYSVELIYSNGGSIYSYEYATVKYNSSGIVEWVARYKGPVDSFSEASALKVDNMGYVYVTGWSNDNYTTVKYNSSGVEQWIAHYNGSGNGSDHATALALDNYGNVYVTGTSNETTSAIDYTTIKYDSSGVEQWVVHYNGPGNDYDEAQALAVDDQGNVYVTGNSEGLNTYEDYATIKYNSSGVMQWVARYDYSIDYSTTLVLDKQYNIYVTGISNGDYATIKYNSSGMEQWVSRYSVPGSNEGATAIITDDQGNVYVTGYSEGSEIVPDYATVKYDSSGNEQWVAHYNSTGYDHANALALDDSGNVYVTGYSESNSAALYTTIKYEQTFKIQSIDSSDHDTTDYDTVDAPVTYKLEQNYPNPFNSITNIRFSIPMASHVTLDIFNLLGQGVAVLVNENKSSDLYTVQFDASKLASGVYIYRINAGNFQTARKMILIR